MIVGLCGFIGSGKDTVADYLVTAHGFKKESFAGSLKDAVSQVFGWDRTLLEGGTNEAREWREQVDTWWAERLSIPYLTPRWVLQYWGTEVCRKGFHDDMWIASLENKLRNSKDNIVISDCRFPNEIKAVKDAGGMVIRIIRGPDPEWYIEARAGDKAKLLELGIHSSETAWVGTQFDAIIQNNGSLAELYAQVESLVQGGLRA